MSVEALKELAAHIAERKPDAVIATHVSAHGELSVHITPTAVLEMVEWLRQDPTAAEILALKGATEAGEGAAGLPDPDRLMAEAGELIGAFNKMRRAEGAAVGVVLLAQIDKLAALTEAAAQAAQARGASHAARMRAALAALLDQTDLDEARLLQEMAILALKTDVTEEIDRLRAHVGAARDLLAQGGAVGRKLDFLMQEFNREANTLCSKAQDGALTALGLDLKLVIDQTREQVQNVE